MRHTKRVLGLVAGLALLASACTGSGDKKASSSTSSTNFPPLTSPQVTPGDGSSEPTLPGAITTVAPGSVTTVAIPTTSVGVQDSHVIYIVKAGDSLGKIASALGVSKADLIALNNITDPNKITVGTKLKVPVAPSATTIITTPGQTTTKAPPQASGLVYVVKAGDTLGKIATALKVSLADLEALNNITNPDKIYVGLKLKVPASAGAASATTTKPKTTATTTTVKP
jgi:LysM repeat protein